MLRLLQSIFGHGETNSTYPENLIRAAIERVVDGTDPWLRAVSGYKKKLRPAVLSAMDHVVALVDGLPPPVTLGSESNGNAPLLKAFFISTEKMRETLRKDRNLTAFLRAPGTVSQPVTALLLMDKTETRTLGVEMDGDRVMRDVPQTVVSFDSHRLLDPALTERETRLQLKKRAFDYLIRIALQRISAVKSERKNLEQRNTLLRAKIDVLRRGGWGFNGETTSHEEDIGGLEESLRRIEADLLALGSDDRMLGSYLGIACGVLERPEEHLMGGKETLIVDSMGIKRDKASRISAELTLTTLCDSAGRCRVAQLFTLSEQILHVIRN